MAKKPDELKGDKFTLYITPKGKAGNLPNMVILHNNSGKQVGSLTMSQIMPFVMENSTMNVSRSIGMVILTSRCHGLTPSMAADS